MGILKEVEQIDLWIAVGNQDVRAIVGAFTDDMHIPQECAYDRYKIVKNCNFLPKCHNCTPIEVRLRPKQTAVIFYKQDHPIRLLVTDSTTDLQSCINMAMVKRIDHASLQRIIEERGITYSEVDLGEPRQEIAPVTVYENEIDFFSCNRWSLFQSAINGRITDQPNEEDCSISDTIPDLQYHPDIRIKCVLRTDEEVFNLRHQGIFCDAKLTFMLAPQIGSSLAPITLV